jgi:hypothetical protein
MYAQDYASNNSKRNASIELMRRQRLTSYHGKFMPKDNLI